MNDDVEELILINEGLNVLAELEENRGYRCLLMQRADPFVELTDEKFIKLFRLSKDLTRELINIVYIYIAPPTRRSALSIETKVLVALKFFGYGSYQEITGSNVFVGISQPSVSIAIDEVAAALNQEEIFNRFYRKYHMPGAIGSIDCTQIAIVTPRDLDHPEHIYVNRKGYHSINVQLTCDENLKILHVNAKFPGSSHDAHIWRESNISTTMERVYRRNPNEQFFY